MIRRWPVHPVLLAVVLITVVWIGNVAEVTAAMTRPAYAAFVVIALLLWGTALLAVRDLRRSAVLASVLVLLLLGFRTVFGGLTIVGLVVTPVAVVGTWRWVRALGDEPVGRVTTTLNGLTATATVVALAAVALLARVDAGGAIAVADAAPGTGVQRDLVWIVPDRYGGEAALATAFSIDDSGFSAALEQRGFTVATDARANYPRTAMSLAAQLNLDYLDDVVSGLGEESADAITPMYPLLDDHVVGRLVTDAGYEYTHLGSWWSPTASAAAATDVRRAGVGGEFLAAVTSLTVASVAGVEVGGLPVDHRERHIVVNEFALDELDALAREIVDDTDDAPQFVLVHLALPHEPYVFASDGRVLSVDEEAARSEAANFTDQLAYLNTRLLDAIDVLVEAPDATAPIVLVQADEGPHPTGYRSSDWTWSTATTDQLVTKLSILSAVRVPGDPDAIELEAGVTGVNVARRAVATALGIELDELRDRSYVYPGPDDLYSFIDVTDRLDDAIGSGTDR